MPLKTSHPGINHSFLIMVNQTLLSIDYNLAISFRILFVYYTVYPLSLLRRCWVILVFSWKSLRWRAEKSGQAQNSSGARPAAWGTKLLCRFDNDVFSQLYRGEIKWLVSTVKTEYEHMKISSSLENAGTQGCI